MTFKLIRKVFIWLMPILLGAEFCITVFYMHPEDVIRNKYFFIVTAMIIAFCGAVVSRKMNSVITWVAILSFFICGLICFWADIVKTNDAVLPALFSLAFAFFSIHITRRLIGEEGLFHFK